MHAPSLRHTRGFSWLRAVGLLCCAFPLGILLMFAAGESAEGIPGAFGHLVQAAPLLLLMVVAWWRPLVGGALIVVAAIALAVLYTGSVGDPQMTVYGYLFAPAILGGLLLMAAGRIEAVRE
ncbi:MAG: hypothetical protein AB1736_02950 [Chloroflexota bacterium]